jgi:hypothetical protein
MTHWDVARCTIVGGLLGLLAFAGYFVGGLVYAPSPF